MKKPIQILVLLLSIFCILISPLLVKNVSAEGTGKVRGVVDQMFGGVVNLSPQDGEGLSYNASTGSWTTAPAGGLPSYDGVFLELPADQTPITAGADTNVLFGVGSETQTGPIDYHDDMADQGRITIPASRDGYAVRVSGAVYFRENPSTSARIWIDWTDVTDTLKRRFYMLNIDCSNDAGNSDMCFQVITPELIVTDGDYFQLELRSSAANTLALQQTWFSLEVTKAP